MDSRLAAAIERLRGAFARYPMRDVLDGCPCCCPPQRVADFDLFSLSLRLGGTVGTFDDFKARLPLMLESLASAGELDEAVVLGRLAPWDTWPDNERDAIDGYLRAVWGCLLSSHPGGVGAVTDAASFLRPVTPLYGSPDRFLRAWARTVTPPADRHLADLVHAWVYGIELPAPVVDWLRRPAVRERLYTGFCRDPDAPAADTFARAYDFLAS